jgi:hypothetical protein
VKDTNSVTFALLPVAPISFCGDALLEAPRNGETDSLLDVQSTASNYIYTLSCLLFLLQQSCLHKTHGSLLDKSVSWEKDKCVHSSSVQQFTDKSS